MTSCNLRILVVNDNPAIHHEFIQMLTPRAGGRATLSEIAIELLGSDSSPAVTTYQIDFASQGATAFSMVRQALVDNKPYALMFMDVHMAGWDGIETATRIWQRDPNLQIVMCAEHRDHSWTDIRRQLGRPDRLFILKKPFDNIEVLQLAEMLTAKWRLAQQDKQHLIRLEQIAQQRADELRSNEARLAAMSWQLQKATELEQQAMNTQVRYRRILEDELRHALKAGEFTVYYQPLVDIATRRIVSLEALVRWQHPKDGLISPAVFIPVAEDSGLILPLGEFVLRTVCEQSVQWSRDGIATVPVAVNVSAVQLQRENMWKLVRRILRDTGLEPQKLRLEITESSLIKDAQQHIKYLHGLRRDGVRSSIDDFGTGYSSLSYLKQLPIDTLKIDRSFISQLDTNSQDETIVNAILTMAHSLGLKVVAEGVETVAQLDVLRRYGCDVAQGFLFSRPVDAETCRELLRDGSKRSWPADAHRTAPEIPQVIPKLTVVGKRR